METKRLYIVLTRSNTVLSGLIHRVKKDAYTHAALSLDKNFEYMFSFGRRHTNNPFIGCFRRESLSDGVYARCGELLGLILELPVTSDEYERAMAIIEDFLLNNHYYGYNYMGLVGGLFGIDSNAGNRFLCSEFVYYVLHKCGICDLGLPRGLIRPQDLLRVDGTVIYEGDLKQYATNTSVICHHFHPLRLVG